MVHHVFTRLRLFSTLAVNYIATLSASRHIEIAELALGEGAVQDPGFYASIHQQFLDDQYETSGKEISREQLQKEDMEQLHFEDTEWDLIRAGAVPYKMK